LADSQQGSEVRAGAGFWAPLGRNALGIEIGGLFGLLVLIADVWALVNVLGSSDSTGKKVVWIVLILVLPLLGWLIWLLAGPRAAK
jgi:hypothetical protein